MAQRYEAGKEFKELLIANYDYYERENAKPKQLTLFDIYGDENYDYEKILKESIISCKIRCKNSPSLRWFPCRMKRLWTQALRLAIPCSSQSKKEKSQWRKSSLRTWTLSVMATAKAVPCYCSTALVAAKPVPVRIIVKETRCDNYDPDVSNPW